jgi:hypothetical protein
MDLPAALTDARATEVTGLTCDEGSGLDADAVVRDGECQVGGGMMKRDLDVPGGGVFEGIRDGFLSDHAEVMDGVFGQGW